MFLIAAPVPYFFKNYWVPHPHPNLETHSCFIACSLPQIYAYVVSFLILYPPVDNSFNVPLPTSQSAVTLRRLIPKSKNKSDQTLLSPSNTHSLSVPRLLTNWGCYPPETRLCLGSSGWFFARKPWSYWFWRPMDYGRRATDSCLWTFWVLNPFVFLFTWWATLDVLSMKFWFFFYFHLLFSPLF